MGGEVKGVQINRNISCGDEPIADLPEFVSPSA